MAILGLSRSSLFGIALVAGLALNAPANATTTIDWTGGNTFDDASMTWGYSDRFLATAITDITGSGLYEACCASGSTYFTLDLKLSSTKYGSSGWVTIFTWSTTGDSIQKSLANLWGPPSDNPTLVGTGVFGPLWVAGIRFTSNPNGGDNDPNFNNFKFTERVTREQYFQQNKWKYSGNDDDEKRRNCDNSGDYDEYIKHVTTFVFDGVIPPENTPGPTPIPGALPLFTSGIAVMGGLLYRRKRQNKAKA